MINLTFVDCKLLLCTFDVVELGLLHLFGLHQLIENVGWLTWIDLIHLHHLVHVRNNMVVHIVKMFAHVLSDVLV
jgi:hypothetical protein